MTGHITRLEDEIERLKRLKDKLLQAAKNLREAQKVYMQNRGNEELGAKVGVASQALDVAIEEAS